MPLTIIVVLLLVVFGFGGGYYGNRQWGENYQFAGPGVGIGTILLILLVCYLLGVFGHRVW